MHVMLTNSIGMHALAGRPWRIKNGWCLKPDCDGKELQKNAPNHYYKKILRLIF
jgi:hypothetical protein